MLYFETGFRLFSRSTVRIGELPLGTVTAYDTTEAQAVTRAYRSPSSDNREVLIGAQTSCGAEVLRGAGALAREHSGKRTTSVLEPALSEAEGCRTASLSHCHSERLQPRGICCRQSSWYVWCGPYCPRNSVPDDVGVSVLAHAGTDYARTAWCAILSRFVRKGEAIPCGGHSCPRDPIPDDVGASVLARAPLTIVILEEAESCARAGLPTKDLRIRTPLLGANLGRYFTSRSISASAT